MRALVLDMTHGGDLIARRLLAEEYEVDCVDVYHNSPADRKGDLEEYGIRVMESSPSERYDLAAMPAHCPVSFMGDAEAAETITFSQAVNRLIDDRRFRIEVTGVKGKTSACYLIAEILHNSGRKVLLHSSRGKGPMTDGGHRIDRQVSIAPPYLMTLAAGAYDAIVCEVSLGGSGKADIALITNLAEDYGIAKNTLRASYAKKDILSDGIDIVPDEEVAFWSQWHDGIRGYRRRVARLSEPRLGEGLRVSVDYDGVSEIVLDPSYVATEYLGAMDAALEVAEAMGIPKDVVLDTLRRFKGVVRERNPGISALSVERTMSCLDEMHALDGALVLLDPVSRKVCDKMDADGIRAIAARYGVPIIVTKGDGTRPEIPEGTRLLVELIKEAYQ